MKSFTTLSSMHEYEIHVQLTKNILTINISDLQPADFCKPNLVETMRMVSCPDSAALILSLEDCPAWNIDHSDEQIVKNVTGFLEDQDYGVLAEAFSSWKDDILSKGALQTQWNNGLSERLVQEAARNGLMRSTVQEEATLALLKKASPRHHRTSKHVHADHFIRHEWSSVYAQARAMI